MISRILYPAIAIISLLVLAWALFFRTPGTAPAPAPTDTAKETLESYLDEHMNYGQDFSIKLAQRRIEYARKIMQERPELHFVAQRVADTLQARLDRKAVF